VLATRIEQFVRLERIGLGLGLGIGIEKNKERKKKMLTELLCPGGVEYFQYDLSTLNSVG
jgi:hypothetical protein